MRWVSRSGLVLTDHVPAALRREWRDRGWCPGRDLATLFREQARAHPDQAAVINPAGTVTYAELAADVRVVSAGLRAAGLGERDVVGIALPGGVDAVVAELAVLTIGAVALPVPDRSARTLRSLLGRSRAAGLIGDAAVAGPAGQVLLTMTELRAATPGRGEPAAVDAGWPARIMVSSGSEAEPKMVAYSHDAIAGGRARYVRALAAGPEPVRNFVLAPLASSFGSAGVPVTVAALGGTLLVQPRFDAGEALRMMAEHRPTHVFGVPTMLRRLAAHPAATAMSGLRALVASGDVLPEPVARACRERFGCPVITVYGSSDGVNCHSAAGNRPDPAVCAIRIAGPDGTTRPAGEAGEIWALGPMTPLCYVAAPDLDARYRRPGGWVRTGDRGVLDEQGRLTVLGRLRRVVNRGGYKISPAEVEELVAAHPAVAEAACVPIPDDDLGERLCACITPRPGARAPDLAALSGYLRQRHGLESRKLPEALLVLPELPMTPTGKVCRRTLTTHAAAQAAPSQPSTVRRS
ncbi:class I adenylate-forming enzyme family protein [Amycolatopsis thermalba]|uniref:class I adenylate-forming enzyme family protein n=1 Tax=Amycolatopsis thermalba TaxID=944492 RepID=UPI0019684774|nr:class I adenylate-forming enzyme family protein [Amycolatopsis thermalba]